MSPEQQILDVVFNVLGLIFSSVVGVVFDVIVVPLLQQILTAIGLGV
ncbi:MAG: hypothetical protein IPK83_18425 [Planctomycetes bacterium]|nr:hypothetical protein [Planctomycetota bacterium]